jgi:CubicO group peptidase (beta-lactamase class C family)
VTVVCKMSHFHKPPMKSPLVKCCLSLSAMTLLASWGWAAQLTSEKVQFATTELEKLTEKEMQATGIPGIAIAIVFNDEVIFAKGFGVREVGQANPVDADTVFQVASMSKPISSTVVAALVGEGLLSWDSRISDLDPGFEMHDAWVTRQITVRDLYCHRSGLPDHAGDLLEDLGFTREEIRRSFTVCVTKNRIPAFDRDMLIQTSD